MWQASLTPLCAKSTWSASNPHPKRSQRLQRFDGTREDAKRCCMSSGEVSWCEKAGWLVLNSSGLFLFPETLLIQTRADRLVEIQCSMCWTGTLALTNRVDSHHCSSRTNTSYAKDEAAQSALFGITLNCSDSSNIVGDDKCCLSNSQDRENGQKCLSCSAHSVG